ncbi:MAG: 6-bladed beta-propeller [Candidatus Kryptoniota bacterium]
MIKRALKVAIPLILIGIIGIYSIVCNHKYRRTQLPDLSRTLSVLIARGLKASEMLTPCAKISLHLPPTLAVDPMLDRKVGYVDSALVIANSIDREIWIVNDSGRIIRVMGRRGEGPGEFMELTCFTVTPVGRIYVYDSIERRFTVLGMKGNVIKVFHLKGVGLKIRHIAVDSLGRILAHHTPSVDYPGFISVIDTSGDVEETVRTEVDWKYRFYYDRGFLDGDIVLVGKDKVVEGDLYSGRVWIGGLQGSFLASDFGNASAKELPLFNYDDKNRFKFFQYEIPFYHNFFVYSDSFVLQHFVSADDRRTGRSGQLKAYDLYGHFLGNVTMDLDLIPNMGDQKYAIQIRPHFAGDHLDELNPFEFVICKWLPLNKLMNPIRLNGWSLPDVELIDTDSFESIDMKQMPKNRLMLFASEHDCQTCLEISVSELKRALLTLKARKSAPLYLVIINSDLKFARTIRQRYGWNGRIFAVPSNLTLMTPLFTSLNEGRLTKFEVRPSTSNFNKLNLFIDSVDAQLMRNND